MLTHLSQRWDYITSLYESGKLEEEDSSSDAQEVLEDILVRNLTREYLEVLKVCWNFNKLILTSSFLRIIFICAALIARFDQLRNLFMHFFE